MKLAIIVPEYNEGQRVVATVKAILAQTKSRVIVVDDGSENNTFEKLIAQFENNKRVILLQHAINLGKGAAMKTGIKKAWRLGCDRVIFVDADGQHNPSHLHEFESQLQKYDLVFGYRSMGVEMPSIRKWGNILSINLMKTFFKINRADLLCGYFGFKKRIYKQIKWTESRYGVETEIAVRVGKKQIPFSEVKIDTIYIDKYKGVTIFDAIKIFFKLPYWYIKK